MNKYEHRIYWYTQKTKCLKPICKQKKYLCYGMHTQLFISCTYYTRKNNMINIEWNKTIKIKKKLYGDKIF